MAKTDAKKVKTDFVQTGSVDPYRPEAGPYGPGADYLDRDESTGNGPTKVVFRVAYERVVIDDSAGKGVGKDRYRKDGDKDNNPVDTATVDTFEDEDEEPSGGTPLLSPDHPSAKKGAK